MSHALSPPNKAFSGNLYGVASMIVWAAGFPAAEELLDTWDPLALVAARFCIALSVLLPLWIVLDGPRAVISARWRWGLLSGAIAFGGAAWLMLLAQSLTDPVTVAIIAAATPIAGTLIEWVSERRALKWAFVIGLAASVIGGIVATGGSVPVAGGLSDLWLGVFCAVGSCFLFSWGSFTASRDFGDQSPIGRTTITLCGGLVFTVGTFILARALGLAEGPEQIFDARNLGLLAIYGIGGMAISQFLWIASVDRLGIALASFHTNVAPFYVMLILVAIGGAWSWPQAIGAAIVALGVVVAQR